MAEQEKPTDGAEEQPEEEQEVSLRKTIRKIEKNTRRTRNNTSHLGWMAFLLLLVTCNQCETNRQLEKIKDAIHLLHG